MAPPETLAGRDDAGQGAGEAVNTPWPLSGISNQMLAAVALALRAVAIFRMKRERCA